MTKIEDSVNANSGHDMQNVATIGVGYSCGCCFDVADLSQEEMIDLTDRRESPYYQTQTILQTEADYFLACVILESIIIT